MDEVEVVVDIFNSNIDKVFSFGKGLYKSSEQKNKIEAGYQRYIYKSRIKYSKLKCLWSTSTAVDFYDYYVPIGLSSGYSNLISSPDFSNCLSKSNRIIISGTGGCGKSILMRHIFLSCIAGCEFAPVLVELRDLNDSVRTLEEHIVFIMQNGGFEIDGNFFLEAQKHGNFCFLFDGFDELLASKRESVDSYIKSLSEKFPNCPIFISSRPDERFRAWNQFDEFCVEPLSRASAISLVGKLPVESVFKEKFIEELKAKLFVKHSSFLSNPLLLSIMLLTYHQNAEVPSKLSVFYGQAYEALFQKHDASKGAYSRQRETDLDILDFSRVFSLFSLLTFDKRVFRMTTSESLEYIEVSRERLGLDFEKVAYLNDLLKATCLLIDDGLHVAYSHRSFQEYFVSKYILSEEYDVQVRLIERYWKPFDEDNIIPLLYEQHPELVERAFLMPKLKIAFDRLGVGNEVTDEDALKYLQVAYSLMRIDEGGLAFHHVEDEVTHGHPMLIIGFANKLCGGWVAGAGQPYSALENRLRKALSWEKEDYDNSLLTNKIVCGSPAAQELVSSPTVFGKDYVSNAYKIYTGLRDKYKDRAVSLFDLLGEPETY